MTKFLASVVAMAMIFSVATVVDARGHDEIEVSNHDITVIVESEAEATVDDVLQVVKAEKGGRASRISLTTGETWAESMIDADVASTYVRADCHCVDETEVRNSDVFVRGESEAEAEVDDVKQIVEAEKGGRVREVHTTTGDTDARSDARGIRVGYTNITVTD